MEQTGWSGEAAINASGFQYDQTSFHYCDRAAYSFQSVETIILVNTNSLAVKDVHLVLDDDTDHSPASTRFATSP